MELGTNDLKFTSMHNRIGDRQGTRRSIQKFALLREHEFGVLEEESFKALLALERRRVERSRKPFVLMLLDASATLTSSSADQILRQMLTALNSSIRETDFVGWYETGAILGVLFTEIDPSSESSVSEVLRVKIQKVLEDHFDRQQAKRVAISVHIFPQKWNRDDPDRMTDTKLYPDLSQRQTRNRFALALKRTIDITGSTLLLILLLPVLTVIAIAIRLTSKGSVLFKQERLGQFGARFKVLKFRTMYVNNDPKIHQDYARRFIAGKDESAEPENGIKGVYKITNDPRVTPIGRLLRRASLDEFPQLWNVLRGEMSLVGPRPPVPYEFEMYDIWHRRRVMEVKPGITGLWQVSGRSRTRFDDMVRLDLRYYQSWSLWLDLKILLRTPLTVFFGEGAY